MDTQWYVRIRGQILGPFTTEKLQEMSKRGEFSRTHEVSQDGLSWERASLHPELFPAVIPKPKPSGGLAQQAATSRAQDDGIASASVGTTGGGKPTAPSTTAPIPAISTAPPSSPIAPPLWYYMRDGKPVGPIAETELRNLFATGQLSPQTLVWTENLPAWCPAQNAFEYLAAPAAYTFGRDSQSQADTLPDFICQTALRIRSWTLFLTVMYGLIAFLSLISSVTVIALATQSLSAAHLVGGGIGALVQSIVWGVSAFMMYTYTSSLKMLTLYPTMRSLQKSLHDLYNYFLVEGIVYILGIILVAVLVLVLLILLLAYA
ncbi:MAG: DUF4339 domain-containing protein [Thermoguttaceae bacterium]|nr:DUF4339 domain-containing protein [Thermoguttaceae bacterium]MDW8038840.1 DUF4339 domain-containing protein [Thermoguttaceae bacterium]